MCFTTCKPDFRKFVRLKLTNVKEQYSPQCSISSWLIAMIQSSNINWFKFFVWFIVHTHTTRTHTRSLKFAKPGTVFGQWKPCIWCYDLPATSPLNGALLFQFELGLCIFSNVERSFKSRNIISQSREISGLKNMMKSISFVF